VSAGRVAAGTVAELWLRQRLGVEIVAWVSAVGPVNLDDARSTELRHSVTRADVDTNAVRCPDGPTAERMTEVNARLDEASRLPWLTACI